MSKNEIEEKNIDSPEDNRTIGYHLFHTLFPIILLNPNTDIETLKKNFFFFLDNRDVNSLKHLFIGFCKTAAEIAYNRQFNLLDENDNKIICDTPGFLILYFSLQLYSIIELKSKTRIYIWHLPKPASITEPHYIAIVLLSKKREDIDSMIRYITLESSFISPMLCEWTKKSEKEECHQNYGHCENDKNTFLERVLNIIHEDRESIKSISDYSLIEDRHSNN